MRAAGTAAVNWPAPTKVVASTVEFHWTVAPETKPLPFTVSVKAGPPAVIVEGSRLVIVTGVPVMVKLNRGDHRPGPSTVMKVCKGCASKVAGMAAVNVVELRYVVTSADEPIPSQTAALVGKPTPVNVTVRLGDPAGAEFGVTLLRTTST